MQEEEEGEVVARLLRETAPAPVPPADPHLAARMIRRARSWILMGDLLRLATFEVFWARLSAGRRDANTVRQRQDR